MSLFGALFTGVSALSAQSQKMSTISNNIANVGTIGYKKVNTDFSSLVTSASGGAYSPGGVLANTKSSVDAQGVLQQTASATDLAISGEGFIVVRQNATDDEPFLYTRAGSFQEDNNGLLRNTAGMVLYGWPLDNAGNIPSANANLSSLEPVNVSFLGGQTKATNNANVALNLKSDDVLQTVATPATATPASFSRQITVFDSLGAAQTITLKFSHTNVNNAGTTGPNQWLLNVTNAAGASLGTPKVLSFDGNGKLNAIAGSATTTDINITGINWGNGSSTQAIDLDLSAVTQYQASYNVTSITQDGAALGLRTGVEIDKDGIVSATFSNGTFAKLYKIPLATFTAPNGLEEQSGNAYSVTSASGDYNLREAGQAGAGQIAPTSLETSNVDLADEFANMIVTQRAYSAGTKVITTADQMLDALLQIR